METLELTDADRDLVDAAREVTAERFDHGRHYVGAAVRSTDGDVYTGVNIETNIGRAAVCAEPVALGNAVTAGVTDFEAITAVRHPAPDSDDKEIFVVAPCGVCREMITDFGRDIEVIFDDSQKARAIDLLPSKYIKSYRQQHVED